MIEGRCVKRWHPGGEAHSIGRVRAGCAVPVGAPLGRDLRPRPRREHRAQGALLRVRPVGFARSTRIGDNGGPSAPSGCPAPDRRGGCVLSPPLTVTHELPRIPGEAVVCRLRHCSPGRARRAHAGRSGRGREGHRRRPLGGQGADPCRRPRQGRRRQAGQDPRRGARVRHGMLGTKMATYQSAGVALPIDTRAGHRRPPTSPRSCTCRCWSTAARQSVTFIASSEGGVEIEKVAEENPDAIQTAATSTSCRACSPTSAANSASRWA